MARANLAKEEPLRLARERVAAKHEEVRGLKVRPSPRACGAALMGAAVQADYDAKLAQVEEIRAQFSPTNIASVLEIAVRDAESEAERLSEDFHDGRIGIEDFAEQFVRAKELVHVRKLKRAEFDKLTQ